MQVGSKLLSVLVVCVLLVAAVYGSQGDSVFPCDDTHPNMVVLLDSAGRGLGDPNQWSVLDIDDDTDEDTSWMLDGSNCESIFSVCAYNHRPQDNWLISSYISRLVENDIQNELLQQVTLRVEYEVTNCPNTTSERSTNICSQYFNILKYETSLNSVTDMHNTNNYNEIHQMRIVESDNVKTGYVNISFTSEESGFHIAIRDDGTCIEISRLMVFYTVCPMIVVNLEDRPGFIAPQDGFVTVFSSCVENAVPMSGEDMIELECGVDGEWAENQYSECVCESDYYMSNDGKQCLPFSESTTSEIPDSDSFNRNLCRAGYYVSEEGECLLCPNNSDSKEQQAMSCDCKEGYYRYPLEADQPCYLPPSPPLNVTVMSFTATTVTLSWLRPITIRGRNKTELRYTLWYKYFNDVHMDLVDGNTVRNTTGRIVGLMPGVTYYLLVSAETHISSQLPLNSSFSSFSKAIIFEPRNEPVAISNTHNNSFSQDVMSGVIGAMVIGALSLMVIIMVLCFIVGWQRRKRVKSDHPNNNMLISNEQVITSQENEPVYDTIDEDFLSAMNLTPRTSFDNSSGPFVESINPSYGHNSDDDSEQFAESANPSYNANIDCPQSPVCYYNVEPPVTMPTYMYETYNGREGADNDTLIPLYMYHSLSDGDILETMETQVTSVDSDYMSESDNHLTSL